MVLGTGRQIKRKTILRGKVENDSILKDLLYLTLRGIDVFSTFSLPNVKVD